MDAAATEGEAKAEAEAIPWMSSLIFRYMTGQTVSIFASNYLVSITEL
jgi:hypothetical protein